MSKLLKKMQKKSKHAEPAPAAAAAPEAAPEPNRHAALLAGAKKTKPKAASKNGSGASANGADSLAKASTAKRHGSGGQLHITVERASGLNGSGITPFCVLEYDGHQVRTQNKEGHNPEFKEKFHIDALRQENVIVWVYDGINKSSDQNAADDVCLGTFSFRPLFDETALGQEQTFELERFLPTDPEPTGTVTLSCTYSVSSKKVSMADFTILKVVGKGSFGKVMMIRKKDTGRIYAAKVLKKQYLSERGEVAHTVSERKILANNSNPFLVQLKFSFQTPEKIYFCLDYVNGGELFVHLQREGSFSEERSRLYAAQLILALDHLHGNNIIYRDLKPENILIDMNGYIKLCDFGLCKMQMSPDGKTSTFCGTPEYMAPEILQQNGYGMEVDWWTVGTLLFEMITGLPPFYDENTQEMYQKILYAPLVFTEEVSPQARLLIAAMLQREPEKRIGRGSVAELQNHPFFANLNWLDLLHRKVKPPWKPRLTSVYDTSNFDPEFTTLDAVDSPALPTLLTQSVQEQFVGFTFVDESELTQH
eukprot:m.15855 g.15855  ORF g.15855 m.15855 type:complete len:536 (+) comp5109_c0_seq1:417-2024(+)